jgi:hypothetical protein
MLYNNSFLPITSSVAITERSDSPITFDPQTPHAVSAPSRGTPHAAVAVPPDLGEALQEEPSFLGSEGPDRILSIQQMLEEVLPPSNKHVIGQPSVTTTDNIPPPMPPRIHSTVSTEAGISGHPLCNPGNPFDGTHVDFPTCEPAEPGLHPVPQLTPQTVEDPIPFSVEDPIPASVEDPVPSSVGDPIPPSVGDSTPPVAEDIATKSVEESTIPSVTDFTAPFIEDMVTQPATEPIPASIEDSVASDIPTQPVHTQPVEELALSVAEDLIVPSIEASNAVHAEDPITPRTGSISPAIGDPLTPADERPSLSAIEQPNPQVVEESQPPCLPAVTTPELYEEPYEEDELAVRAMLSLTPDLYSPSNVPCDTAEPDRTSQEKDENSTDISTPEEVITAIETGVELNQPQPDPTLSQEHLTPIPPHCVHGVDGLAAEELLSTEPITQGSTAQPPDSRSVLGAHLPTVTGSDSRALRSHESPSFLD